ncbi:immunoglobulin-like domain-containing protein [Listeria booriae]|uniref:Bacterial Ig domain-containing protein n=1 Tax=Listeria booriae TaxID=1552123 RepID=A0A7X0WDX1_9LIST|nr:immunoglobulin-like domain-containing protein [Listeria booriae]MBC1331756.1 hypothetical protein [Listeria booriae]MBC2387533.1 hypothetical protein [Listeria booriae]
MKTCLKVAVLLSSVLAIWWGIINQNPHQVAAQQKNISDPIIITTSYNPIEGIALPNAKIILTDYLGNTTDTIADKTGKFSLYAPVAYHGTVDIHQELNGLSGSKNTIQIRRAITISSCSTTELVLYCVAANADIQIRTETGVILSQGKTGSDQQYTIDLTKIPDGTTLTSVLKSGGLEYHFSYTLLPTAPKFIVTETTEYDIKGVGMPAAEVGILGESRFTINPDGSFHVRFYKHIPIGTKLYFNQVYNLRVGHPQEVLIGWSQKVNPVTAASTKLTGTGTPNIPTHVQTENGRTIGRGQADKDGNYTITIPIQAEGTKLRVFQTIAGTEYMSTITVEKNPYTLTPTLYQIGNSNVTGTYTGTDLDQITKVVLLIDGVIVKNGAFNNTTKTFQISANGLVTNTNQRVEVALFHGNAELKRAPVTVTARPSATYTVTPATYQLGTSLVTGTYTGTDLSQITKVVLLVDGVVVKNGAFNNTTKAFQISAGGLVKNSKQRVEVALFNGTKELKRATVFVIDAYTLITATYQIGSGYVTGSYSGLNTDAITKAVLLVDGVVVKNGALNTSDNTFRIAANGFVTNIRQRVEVALFNNTTELKRATVAVSSGGSYSITATPYQLGGSYITGTYTGTNLEAITKVSLLVDGVVVKNGTLAPTTKTFQIYANGFVTTANQRVEVALYVGSTQVSRTSVPFR